MRIIFHEILCMTLVTLFSFSDQPSHGRHHHHGLFAIYRMLSVIHGPAQTTCQVLGVFIFCYCWPKHPGCPGQASRDGASDLELVPI